MEKIQPCDILLRRYNNYLDGLIFSQNSYFTHAAIFYGNYEGRANQVLHATSEKGVHFDDLKSFCQCDDVAVLRFTTEVTEEETTVRTYIEEAGYSTPAEKDLLDKELSVFEGLMKDIKHISSKDSANLDTCKNIILERGESLKGTPYDSQFNFKSFDALSCIEFVWYCFKCLFPLHRIRVKDFEYFGMFELPVIVPDVFIKNDYFKYIYSSIKKVQGKGELRKYIRTDRSKVKKFVINIFIWEAVILTGCYFFNKYILQA